MTLGGLTSDHVPDPGLITVTVGLTVGLVALLMAGMGVGVIVSNRRLAGSCGGTGVNCLCEKRERGECPGKPEERAERLIGTDLSRPRP